MRAPMHLVVMAVIFFAVVLAAISLLALGWRKWLQDMRKQGLKSWRRAAGSLGFAMITMQAIALGVFWFSPQIGRSYLAFSEWTRVTLYLFLAASVLVLTAKGPSRWLGLLASATLFVICFFISISA